MMRLNELDLDEMRAYVEESSGEKRSRYKTVRVRVEDIEPNPYQPRKTFEPEKIAELAESIRGSGLLQPPVVRLTGSGNYVLVAGERRLRAIKSLNWAYVDVIVRADMTEEQAATSSVLENFQREDVNVLEEAEGIQTMMTKLGLTQAQVALRLGITQAKVSQMLSLLTLIPRLQEMYLEQRMNQSVGRIIAQLPADVQEQLVEHLPTLTAIKAQAFVNAYKHIVNLKEAGMPEVKYSLASYDRKDYVKINHESFKVLLANDCVNEFDTILNIVSTLPNDTSTLTELPRFTFFMEDFLGDCSFYGTPLTKLFSEYGLQDANGAKGPRVKLQRGVKVKASRLLGEFLAGYESIYAIQRAHKLGRLIDIVKRNVSRSTLLLNGISSKTKKGHAALAYHRKAQEFVNDFDLAKEQDRLNPALLIQGCSELIDEYERIYAMPDEKNCIACWQELGEDVVYDPAGKGPYHGRCLSEKRMLDSEERRKRNRDPMVTNSFSDDVGQGGKEASELVHVPGASEQLQAGADDGAMDTAKGYATFLEVGFYLPERAMVALSELVESSPFDNIDHYVRSLVMSHVAEKRDMA